MKPQNVLNLNAKKLRELLSHPNWTLNDELTDLLRATTNDTKTGACVYSDPDGQVIHVYSRAHERGLLYLDRNDFVSRLTKLRTHVEAFRAQYGDSMHILEGHFLYGEDFPQYVPALLDQIPTLFKVPREALDHSWESLDLLTRKVKHMGRQRALEPQYFAPIVAYIGECIRALVKGEWLMVRSWQMPAIWEPCVKGKDGRIHDAYFVYYEMLDDSADTPSPISLASAVSFARPVRDPNAGPLQPSGILYKVKPEAGSED